MSRSTRRSSASSARRWPGCCGRSRPRPVWSSSATTCARRRPSWSTAFAEGVAAHGLDVVNIGLASTDMLYFASGALDVPGAMFTASHNPAKYNGIKLCRAGATPIGADTGLATIREAVEQGVPAPAAGTVPGTVEKRDMLADYAAYLRGLVDLSTCRPLRVVVDAGNGMAGYTVPEVLGGAAAGRRAAVLRAGRHLPQPRGEPAGPGEPGRPAEGRRRRGCGHRAGLRRRRRPLLRHRRARRAGEPERDHRRSSRSASSRSRPAAASSTT